jgi:tRNA dimethylallyltransferase
MALERGCESPTVGALVVVLGATATGKSRFAIDLAQRIGGEIVSADSRQVYRGMDIGTGKVTEAERTSVPHHLLDVVDPDEPFGLADYCDLAHAAISEIRARGRIPIMAGGSGQYVWALAEGWIVPRVAPDQALRSELAATASRDGGRSLHAELARIDPMAADAIDPRNVRRVIRALEIASATGAAPSTIRSRRRPPESIVLLGLDVPRPEVLRRIDLRVEAMIADGLVAEVERLMQRGYDPALPSMSGIGYTQVVQFLCGDLSLDMAVSQIKAATHRLARQQSSWFRRSDGRIAWLGAAPLTEALRLWNATPALGAGRRHEELAS